MCELLVPDSFYDPVNRKIYEAISELGFNQRPIDMMTVTEQLRQDNALGEVGGAVHIAELITRLFGAHVEYHAKIIAQKYLARRLIAFSSRIETRPSTKATAWTTSLQEAEENCLKSRGPSSNAKLRRSTR